MSPSQGVWRREDGDWHSRDTLRLLVGETPAIRLLLDEIGRVATREVAVLIEGETGTGKELVARSIHRGSRRRGRPLVAVNCAELTVDAAESQLFGHRKGSFTNAIDDHKGFFEVADGTTLFLDEVGELGLGIQSKLLRVLQEGEIVRFGDSRPRKVDVRLIAATNRRLEEEVKAGRFREDLLYRLRVVPIRVPPLRERREDVPLLVEHLMALHSCKLGLPLSGIAPDALHALVERDFPGNVRDLENVIVRALVLSEPGDVIGLAHLTRGLSIPPCHRGADPVPGEGSVLEPEGNLFAAMARYERLQIERALAWTNGNRSEAARVLGISRRWLLAKLRRYGMPALERAREH